MIGSLGVLCGLIEFGNWEIYDRGYIYIGLFRISFSLFKLLTSLSVND